MIIRLEDFGWLSSIEVTESVNDPVIITFYYYPNGCLILLHSR